jgi:hypothetical protein
MRKMNIVAQAHYTYRRLLDTTDLAPHAARAFVIKQYGRLTPAQIAALDEEIAIDSRRAASA